jgi:hypothetical protein
MQKKLLLLTAVILGILILSGLPLSNAHEEGECPSDHFLDTSDNPEVVLEVSCTEDSVVIVTNNLPDYQVPGTTVPESYTWYLPLVPEAAETPIELPRLDAVAVGIDGIQIHGPNGAPFDDYVDPVAEGMMVTCGGHHAEQTLFHHHATPDCLYGELVENPEDPSQLVGIILAYAFDGYPILSPYVCTNEDCSEVKELQSSWQHVADVTNAWEANEYVEGSGDLDQCNGMELEDGSYAYFATETFPYLLGCYHGIPDERSLEAAKPQGGEGGQQGGQGQPPQGGGDGQQPPPPPDGGQGGQQPPPPPPGN